MVSEGILPQAQLTERKLQVYFRLNSLSLVFFLTRNILSILNTKLSKDIRSLTRVIYYICKNNQLLIVGVSGPYKTYCFVVPDLSEGF